MRSSSRRRHARTRSSTTSTARSSTSSRCSAKNVNALELLARYDSADTVAYVDPPYLWSTRTSFNDAKGYRRRPRGDYSHEFNSDADHRALADVLHQVEATVLLSGYASDLYDNGIYADWHRIERNVPLHMSNGKTAKGTRPRRVEVLWSNRPFLDGQLDLVSERAVEVRPTAALSDTAHSDIAPFGGPTGCRERAYWPETSPSKEHHNSDETS